MSAASFYEFHAKFIHGTLDQRASTSPLLFDLRYVESTTNITQPSYILSGMRYTPSQTLDMFVWGTVLLYSANAGESMYVLASLSGNATIVDFSSSVYGTFVYMTSRGEVRSAFKFVPSHRIGSARVAP
jgi:hypothetical protein